MVIKTLNNGAVTTVSDSYGARLIEQGKAVLMPAEAVEKADSVKAAKAEKDA